MKNIKITKNLINVLDGTNSPFCRLPYINIKSHKKGPVVWLTACVHGDEVGGIVVIQEIVNKLKKELTSGEVHIFPLMNPRGFEMISRNLTLSEEDLNRSFPGNAKGTLAKRIAHQIFSEIKKTKPDLVLDLHNHWSYSVPHALIDRDPPKKYNKIYNQALKYAKLSGLVPVIDTDEPKGSLSDSLIQKGICSFTLELGESFIINEENVQIGVNSLSNIFSELNMIKNTNVYRYRANELLKDKILTYYDKPLASKSGIIRYFKNPGDIIKKGEKFAEIYDVLGSPLETLKARKDALVLGYTDFAAVFPGTTAMAFGIINKK